MIQVTITANTIKFKTDFIDLDSVLEGYELVDEYSIHFITGMGVFLLNVDECKFNGNKFNTAAQLELYLVNL